MKKALIIFLFFIGFFSFYTSVFASMTATDNMDGTVEINSTSDSPFVVCYDATYDIPDDNLHSSVQASSVVPFNMTNATGFQLGGIVAGREGYYTCFGYNGSNMPPWPTSVKVYQSADEYVEFYWDGSNIPAVEETCFDGIQNQDETGIDTGGVCDTTTRVVNISPVNGATTTTTDVLISADYYLNSNTDFGDETGIVVYLNRVDIGNNGEINSFWWDTPITRDSLTSVSHTFAFNSGEIWEMDFLFTRPAPNNPYKVPNLSRFAVVNDPNVGTTGYTTCSITDLGGCFQNALVYLFYPSSVVLRDFNTFYNTYRLKPPIGYIIAIQDELKSINISSSAIFTLSSMPILNTYIFSPLRIAFAWILWVAFAYVLFNRVKDLQL